MSTVRELVTWATHESELRTYLDVFTGEDDNLQLWLGTATQLADEYLERTDLTAPLLESIEVGVYELVKLFRLQWRRGFATTGVQTDALAETQSEALKRLPEYQQVADRFWAGQAEYLWLKA